LEGRRRDSRLGTRGALTRQAALNLPRIYQREEYTRKRDSRFGLRGTLTRQADADLVWRGAYPPTKVVHA